MTMTGFRSSLEEMLPQADDLREPKIALRMAAYSARKGNIDAARAKIAEIRSQFVGRYIPIIYAYLNLSEGICDFFERGVSASLDRLNRARALAMVSGECDDVLALAFSWLANVSRSLGDWIALDRNLRAAASNLPARNSEAHIRLGLVVADSLQELGRYEAATSWYDRVRRRAIMFHDDASISAMLYNRAAIRLYNLRLLHSMGQEIDVEGCRIEIEGISAQNYTLYTREQGLPGVFEIFLGQLELLRGSYTLALETLRSQRADQLAMNWPAVDLVRRADLIHCEACLRGRNEIDANKLHDEIINGGSLAVSFGDAAIALRTLGRVFDLFLSERATSCHKLADNFLSEFHSSQVIQAEVLSNFLSEYSDIVAC